MKIIIKKQRPFESYDIEINLRELIKELSSAGFVIVPKEFIEDRKKFLDKIIVRLKDEDNP